MKTVAFPERFQFTSSHDEEEIFHQDDLIRLTPFGVTLQADSARPFLLLKDVTQEHVLPVALNPLEAGVTLSQSDKSVAPVTPHRFTDLLMASLDIQAMQCVFVQIKGPHQYVRIYLSGHPRTNSIRLRAEDAMSLCLHLDIPIYASRDFIGRSKVLAAQIEGMSLDMKKFLSAPGTPQNYIM